MEEFRLKGPISSPPSTGWRVSTLPAEAQHLQTAWDQFPSQPNNSKAAWWDMVSFLRSNGFNGGDIMNKVKEISVHQWCSPDPRRCRGSVWHAEAPYLPWAKAAWERANNMLADGTSNPKAQLLTIVAQLTGLINGPDGCAKCALHWEQLKRQYPVPENTTLDEARHWLVDRHNDSREGKPRTPFAEVAAKFNWTT